MFLFNRPTKSYGAYLFDFDGTLMDSMPTHMDAWNAGLEASGTEFRLTRKTFLSVAGMNARQTISHWQDVHEIKIDFDVISDTREAYYRERRHVIEPIQEVLEYAQDLFRVISQQGGPFAQPPAENVST